MGDDNEYLYCDEVIIKDVNDLVNLELNKEYEVNAKFRYRQNDIKVTITKLDNNTIRVKSNTLLKAITIGQIACFYDIDSEQLLAAGVIEECYKNNKKLDLI